MAEICLWSAMVDEAPTPYRYGVWGGLTPAQRHRLAAELGHPAVGEYLGRLGAAVEAHQRLRAARGATEMPPEAAALPTEAPTGPHKPVAPAEAVPAAQRTAKQRKRDFRRDRRRRRRISERLAADPTPRR